MTRRDLSREAHLWYTITSPDYLIQANDKLGEARDLMLARASAHPFIDGYAPVPHWIGVMNELLDGFNNAFLMMKQGEVSAMGAWASRLKDIPRGLNESNTEWLSAADEATLRDLLNDAYGVCGRFLTLLSMSTAFSDPAYKDGSADWRLDIPDDLGMPSDGVARYYEDTVFPVLPEHIPEYAPDPAITCATGETVNWTGVWVPAEGMGTAALAFARQGIQIMQPAYEVETVDEDGAPESFGLVACDWHPVKPTGRLIEHPLVAELKRRGAGARLRCESGERCPREGWWSTPGEAAKRRFKLGEVMPAVKGDYGLTIWSWSDAE